MRAMMAGRSVDGSPMSSLSDSSGLMRLFVVSFMIPGKMLGNVLGEPSCSASALGEGGGNDAGETVCN